MKSRGWIGPSRETPSQSAGKSALLFYPAITSSTSLVERNQEIFDSQFFLALCTQHLDCVPLDIACTRQAPEIDQQQHLYGASFHQPSALITSPRQCSTSVAHIAPARMVKIRCNFLHFHQGLEHGWYTHGTRWFWAGA